MKIDHSMSPAERAEQDNLAAGINMISAANVAADEYFTVAGKTYRALAVITSGERITPGINCEEIDVAAVLNQLTQS